VNIDQSQFVRSAVYFSLSLVLTLLFVLACPLYISREQTILSLSIAGGKWAIQIAAVLLMLRKKRGAFIVGISKVCLIGSILLVPYILSAGLGISDEPMFFFGSLILAVLVMIFRYYFEVTNLQVSLAWWYFWLLCLTIAVNMQLTLVFNVI